MTVKEIAQTESTVSSVSPARFGTPFYRRIITMEENFDVVHNVVYYIYTNRIKFSTFDSDDPPIGTEPNVSDAEEIFALAHRLDLVDLKKITLAFLGRTCTVGNITSRVFSQFASLYEEVGQIYEEYFRKEWLQIQKSSEFKEYFLLMEGDNDSQEIIRIFRKFREFVQDARYIA